MFLESFHVFVPEPLMARHPDAYGPELCRDEAIEPCRMADCREEVGLAIGDHHHAADIRKRLLTCQAELRFAKGIGRVGPTLRPQPVAAWHRAAWIVDGSP